MFFSMLIFFSKLPVSVNPPIMKPIADIIYKAPKAGEPVKPGILSVIIVGAVIYLIYLADKGFQLSNVDLFFIPAFILALGLQLFFTRKKKDPS
jgi:hypothetical protein